MYYWFINQSTRKHTYGRRAMRIELDPHMHVIHYRTKSSSVSALHKFNYNLIHSRPQSRGDHNAHPILIRLPSSRRYAECPPFHPHCEYPSEVPRYVLILPVVVGLMAFRSGRPCTRRTWTEKVNNVPMTRSICCYRSHGGRELTRKLGIICGQAEATMNLT